jgi:hypothetical protein
MQAYGAARPLLMQLTLSSRDTRWAVPVALGCCGAAGAFAGLSAALLTNPMDVARTRLQVLEHHRRQNFVGLLAELVREEGLRGLMRGVKARMGAFARDSFAPMLMRAETANMAPSSICLAVGYEFVKMMSTQSHGPDPESVQTETRE